MRNRAITYTIIMAMIITMIAALMIQSGCIENITGPQPRVSDTDTNDTDILYDGNNTLSEQDDGQFGRNNAIVESIEILTLESFPVQIHVIARGYLPDGCTSIDEITKSREGNTFSVTVTTKRPLGVMCTQEIVPFEKTIPIDVYGLGKGVYTVDVNSVSGSFELPTDNIIGQ